MGNRQAFLQTIKYSEGTLRVPGNENGYNVLVGGTLFDSYADHPRILVDLGNGLKSTAAGAYQVLEKYFDAYKEQLGLLDFSPASQDAIALQQIKERGAIPDIDAGNIAAAISRVSNIWASLPGACYGQPENQAQDLIKYYISSGGALYNS